MRPAIAAIDDLPSSSPAAAAAVETACSFTNPSTRTMYRLRRVGPAFRITKSRPDQDRVLLNHLRGVCGDNAQPLDLDQLRAFIKGASLTDTTPTDPTTTFTRVVLLDLDLTASLLTAMARESQALCDHGRPGFRPGCAVFRRQRDAALARAMEGCMEMTRAWLASGLTTTDILPEWLAGGISDAQHGINAGADPR